MDSCNLGQMHVNDLTSFKISVVKVDYHEVRACYLRQEFIFFDFSVVTMPFDNVFSLFLVLRQYFFHALFADISHNFVLIGIDVVLIFIGKFAFFP